MTLTRDNLVTAFPSVAPDGVAPSTAVFIRRLALALASFTDNIDYAYAMARVLLHAADDAPYSTLPTKFQSYRASVDLFLLCTPDGQMTTYLRSIAHALSLKRNPHRFHQALLASARKYNLAVPDAMLAKIRDPARYSCRVSLPLPVYKSLLAQARVTGSSVSEIIRYRVLANETENLECTSYED